MPELNRDQLIQLARVTLEVLGDQRQALHTEAQSRLYRLANETGHHPDIVVERIRAIANARHSEDVVTGFAGSFNRFFQGDWQ